MAVLAFLAFALPVLGQVSSSADTCPAHLFVIERSKNSNIVAYDANRKPDGEIEASKPVVAYWLLNGEKDKREELNRVERQRAYGFDMKRGDVPGTFVMTFKAGRKRRPTIRIINGCPVAMVRIGGHDGILRRMFVQSNEGFLTPKVEYVEFFGVDPAGGGELYEKFVPGK